MALQFLLAALLAVQYTTGQRAASCNQPFVDASGGKAYWWMCAKGCPGGMAWSDISCCCACQRPQALQSYQARCGLLESTTTTGAVEVESSSTTTAAAGSALRPEEAAVAMPLGHSWSRTTEPPAFRVRWDAAAAAAEAALADNSTEEEALAAAFNASRAAGATLLEVASIIASTAASLPDPEDSSPRSMEELTRLVAGGVVAAIGRHDKDAGRIAALAATQIAFDSHMSVEFTMQLAETTALATGASPDEVARIMASLPEDAAIMAQKRAAATTLAPTTTEQPLSTPEPLSLTVDPARLGNQKLITLDGDFASVVTNTKKFLIECTVALSPVLCLKVEPGSIVLTISGDPPELVDAALDHVAAGGLDLPSFGVLRPPSPSSTSAPKAGNLSQATGSQAASSWVPATRPGPSRGIDAKFLAGSDSVETKEPENGFDVWFSLLTIAIAVIGATAAGIWLYRRQRDRIREPSIVILPASEDFENKKDAWESTPSFPPGVPTPHTATPGFAATVPPKSYRSQPPNFPTAHNPWIAGASGFVSAPSFDVRPPGFSFPTASPPPPNCPHPFQPSPFLQPQSQPFPVGVSPGMHGGW